MFMLIVSFTSGQGLLLTDCKVKNTFPLLISVELMRYDAFSWLGPGLNNPPLLLLQVPAFPPPFTVPLRTTLLCVEQIDRSVPAFTMASLVIFIFTESFFTGQTPLL